MGVTFVAPRSPVWARTSLDRLLRCSERAVPLGGVVEETWAQRQSLRRDDAFLLLLPSRLPFPPANPVLLCARGAPGLVWDGRVGAVSAEALFLGPSAFFLGVKTVLLPALRGLVPLAVVLARFLALGFDLGRGESWPFLRLLVLRRGFRFGFPGRAVGFVLSRRFPSAGWASSRVDRLGQGETEFESMAYCPPVRGRLPDVPDGQRRPGSTPAGSGKALGRTGSTRSPTVYPHALWCDSPTRGLLVLGGVVIIQVPRRKVVETGFVVPGGLVHREVPDHVLRSRDRCWNLFLEDTGPISGGVEEGGCRPDIFPEHLTGHFPWTSTYLLAQFKPVHDTRRRGMPGDGP